MLIPNDHLPRLLVTLHDIARMLREECFDVGETGSAICVHVEDWEQSLLVNLSPSITREKLLTLCRHAPSPLVLSALIMQQEALRTLSHNDYHAFLGGLPMEDAAFWNVEGDGYQAMESAILPFMRHGGPIMQPYKHGLICTRWTF